MVGYKFQDMSYEKVLLTTDGSEHSRKALEHAVELADSCNATLHILYVVDIGVDTSFEAVEDLMSQLESSTDLEKIGEDAVENLAEKARKHGLNIVTGVSRGKPHRKILEYSRENDIDIMVMSTHGRSGLDRMLLGSVTEKVLRKSEVPVLAVTRKD